MNNRYHIQLCQQFTSATLMFCYIYQRCPGWLVHYCSVTVSGVIWRDTSSTIELNLLCSCVYFCPQIKATRYRVHEAAAWESQCHPADCQSRHPHPWRMPTIQKAGQWFPQQHNYPRKSCWCCSLVALWWWCCPSQSRGRGGPLRSALWKAFSQVCTRKGKHFSSSVSVGMG